MNLERLANRIRAIKLFSSLGVDIDDAVVVRIRSWNEWVGPEDPLGLQIGMRQQTLHDAIVVKSDEQLWNQALRIAVGISAKSVPYAEGEDSWHAPNIAAWSAAWTFSLEEAYFSRSISVPAEVVAQLYWYERGHWPCAVAVESSGERIQDYVVY
jgi:hypothetical protein